MPQAIKTGGWPQAVPYCLPTVLPGRAPHGGWCPARAQPATPPVTASLIVTSAPLPSHPRPLQATCLCCQWIMRQMERPW